MACVSVRLLGPLLTTLGGDSVAGFASDKVRGLLADLAVEAGQAHRLERLAGLLWPDWPESSARANLRPAIPDDASPPFLHVWRQTLPINAASDAWVDVTAFTDLVAHRPPHNRSARGGRGVAPRRIPGASHRRDRVSPSIR